MREPAQQSISIGFIAITGLLLGFGLFCSPDAPGPPLKDYTLIWSDEFSGTALDTTQWDYRGLGPRRDAVNVKEAVSLDGRGHLVLTTFQHDTAYHTAMIGTQGKFEAKYGYFECRVLLQKQIGHWSAFWLQTPSMGSHIGNPAAGGTEIDIYEYLRREGDSVHHTVHWDGYGTDHKSAGIAPEVAGLSRGWHNFGLHWTADKYVFYVDGEETWRTDQGVSRRPEYIILSLEVGKWAGDIAEADLPDQVRFDYVRVYQAGIAGGVELSKVLFDSADLDSAGCYRIPALVTAPNGDLIAAIDERHGSCRDLNGNRDINIVMRRSTNTGMTWSDIETVVDFPYGRSASDPSMIVDEATGEIFLFYNYMDLENAPDHYYLHVMRSSDAGLTWNDPEDITSQITKPEWETDFKFITSGRGIQTRSGDLLHCLVNLQNGMHLFGSGDHGRTWECFDKPILPGDESKVVELCDGRWMVNSRVNRSGIRYVHISNDQGRTWQSKPDSVLIDPGCNGSIIRYTSQKDGHEKNRLLFSNARSAKSRSNMTVRISYDEGATWSEGKTVYSGPSAYSSLTVLENGDIGLLFEKDGYKQTVFIRFSLEWLTDGKDTLSKPEGKNRRGE